MLPLTFLRAHGRLIGFGFFMYFCSSVGQTFFISLFGGELREAFGDLVLPPLHRATVLRECTSEGKTIFELGPTSRAADEYAALVWSVLNVR